jgi:uncharacterized membrane protein
LSDGIHLLYIEYCGDDSQHSHPSAYVPITMTNEKSTIERFLQALGYEAIAIGLCTPLFAWLMHTPLLAMGALTLANCVMALVWNVVFNTVFDRLQNTLGFRKTFVTRALHAVFFEGGLMLAGLPLAAWWLDISLMSAAALEGGLLLFFLPYTYLYHWSYDLLRQTVVGGNCKERV